MQLPVMIEPVANTGYRASSGVGSGLSAEGATPDEALERLRALVVSRVAAGARIVGLEVSGHDNPWLGVAGMYEKDPLFDDWQRAIAERRRQIDADPDVP